MRCSSSIVAASAALLGSLASFAAAQPIFTDDFENGLSLLWGNERGNWSVVAGRYGASQPSNNPITYSSLPFVLTDLDLSCDLLAADDGGIWLHADAQGQNGILLVLAHNAIYWHPIVNDNATGTFGEVFGAFTTGENLHLRVTVVGNVYSAYLNGSNVPTTTYSNASYPSGRVGLYDFRAPNHNYDNVTLSGTCASGSCCSYVSRHPQSINICRTGQAVFKVQGAGSGLSYSWEYQIAPGEWLLVEPGDNPDGDFIAAGATTPTLTLTHGDTPWNHDIVVRAIVSSECGAAYSDPAFGTLCPSDFDCTGFGDTDDFTAFVTAFEAGTDDADFDGSGFVDTDDFTAFVLAFEAGC